MYNIFLKFNFIDTFISSIILILSLLIFATETNSQVSNNKHPDCYDFFPEIDYIYALKDKLEEDNYDENYFPSSSPFYEIIWYENDKIKAIIELDKDKKWNGSIHSWYINGTYLGCAGLKSGQHEGISIAYHTNGNLRAIADFRDGKPIGIEYQFNDLGKLSSAKDHGKSAIINNPLKKFKDK